jgi:hypothetical protein
MCRLRTLLLTAAIAAASLSTAAAAHAQSPFAPDSIWNAPLSPTAPIDSRSAGWVQHLTSKVATYGAWMNTTQYSVPIYTVGTDRYTSMVWIDDFAASDQGNFAAVPLPPFPIPAAGTDRTLVVYQPATDTMWEFWGFYHQADGFHAGTGAKISPVSTSNGVVPTLLRPAPWPAPYGATATGLAAAGGLVTPDEVASGQINHALALAIPYPLARAYWALPALRSDGDSPDPTDIPEGVRLRLPASLNIAALKLPPATAALARAAQRYGILIRDRGDCVAFYGQDPQTLSSDPFPAWFGSIGPGGVATRFPWSRLQVIKATPNTPAGWPA